MPDAATVHFVKDMQTEEPRYIIGVNRTFIALSEDEAYDLMTKLAGSLNQNTTWPDKRCPVGFV